jgi:hypothetical protein
MKCKTPESNESLALKALLEPFGITRYFTDGWGAYERHLDAEQHEVGKAHTQKIESKHINLRASFITSEKYITVSWGKPQSFDTAPWVAVLLPDFGSTGRLPGSDRF